MSSLDDAMKAFADAMQEQLRQQKQDQERKRQQFRSLFDDIPGAGWGYGFDNARQPADQINEFNERLKKLKTAPKRKLTPEERLKEIDNELDIIRGVIPTPKGYKIDNSKVKALLKERRELTNV